MTQNRERPTGRKRQRVGIIAFGKVAETLHLPAFRALIEDGEIESAQVFEPDMGRRTRLKNLLPSVPVTAEINDLAKANLDACLVASPPMMHAAHIRLLVEWGIPTLCEKPLVLSLQEGLALAELSDQQAVPVAVAMVRRHFPIVRVLRELLRSGILGSEKIEVRIGEGGKFSWPVTSRMMLDPHGAGGGVFFDHGVHVLDSLSALFGEARLLRYADNGQSGLESECEAQVEYGYATVAMRLSRMESIVNFWEFKGTQGTLCWNPSVIDKAALQLNTGSSAQCLVQACSHEYDAIHGVRSHAFPAYPFPFYAQLVEFLKLVQGEPNTSVTIHQAMQSLTVIQQAYATREPLKT